MTPNHFTKPIQGSRSIHDYGHTRIERTRDTRGTFLLTALLAVGFVAVVLAVVGMGL